MLNLDSITKLLKDDGRIVTAVVYGEAARGRHVAGDVLHLAVVWREDADRSGQRLIALLDVLEAAAGADVNLVDLEKLDATRRTRIIKDGKVLFDLPPGRLQTLRAGSVLDAFDADFAKLLSHPSVTGRRKK